MAEDDVAPVAPNDVTRTMTNGVRSTAALIPPTTHLLSPPRRRRRRDMEQGRDNTKISG